MNSKLLKTLPLKTLNWHKSGDEGSEVGDSATHKTKNTCPVASGLLAKEPTNSLYLLDKVSDLGTSPLEFRCHSRTSHCIYM